MIFKLLSQCFLCLVHFNTLESAKLAPPEFVKPICYKTPCHKSVIRTKIYIEDTLWDRMSKSVGGKDNLENIVQQLNRLSDHVNNHLYNLDNGGFKVDFSQNVVKLGKSEIVLEDTYVDRLNNNVTAEVDPTNIFSHTFTFQEAVQKLADRNVVDLRILFIPERGLDATLATSEETCMCNPRWFGCVGIFSIRYLDNWSFHQSIFAHEIGHTLGVALHDDEFYISNPNDMLLMWSGIGYNALIWSPEAKRRINDQDNSCLEKEILSSSIVFPD